MIDGEGVSVRAVVPRWFGGFFEGGVGTVARGCRRSHGDRTDKVDHEPGDDRHSYSWCYLTLPWGRGGGCMVSGTSEAEGYGEKVQLGAEIRSESI